MQDSFDRCHVCGCGELRPIAGFERLRRVTSDCRPWPTGGQLATCRRCDTVQKVIDRAWEAEVGEIYDTYAIYHQAAGAEQVVAAGGALASRSARLAEFLASREIESAGQLLDVGCGNGAFLRAFARTRPSWDLVGTELSDKYKHEVEQIAGVQRLHVGDAAGLDETFDLVSMIHVLEHLVRPGSYLAALRDRLTAGGLLLIEVPDCSKNPFDLLIADHATHFTPGRLRAVVEAAGYEVVDLSDAWVPKEITLLARPQPGATATVPAEAGTSEHAGTAGVEWLGTVREAARAAASRQPFGIFGTSIAATWLAEELSNSVAFFVDEDANRVGVPFRGRPVLAPEAVPAHASVFVGLANPLAQLVAERVRSRRTDVDWHLPPAADGSRFPR